MRKQSTLIFGLLVLACQVPFALHAAPGNPDAIAKSNAVKETWAPDIKAALGFENESFWRGGTLVETPVKSGKGAIRWADHVTNGGLTWVNAPTDFSAFNALSFWLHSSHANGDTFMIIAESKTDAKVFSYYMAKVAVDWVGWKKVDIRFREFGKARNPAGWDKITAFRFSAGGWNQSPSPETAWVFDDLDFRFDDTPFQPKIRVKKYVDEPPRDAFLANLHKAHPRIILLDEDLERIRQRIDADPEMKQWYENARGTAEKLLRRPVRKHELPDGRRLLSISRDVLNRLFHWGFFYRMEGDRKWLDRAWQEMEAVVAFPDWNPDHYLDTAEMMHAIGLGYDWFYHGLTEEQRKTIREGLWHHGLRLSYAAYMGLEAEGSQGWRQVTNNWNFVCNGGTSLAAMAVLDEMPEECSDLLYLGFQYIQIPIQHFEPDGAWWEGLAYWGYSMRYFLAYLRGLETAFGTDFGFVEALKGHGFEKAGDMPVYLTSPLGGIFNFADSGSGRGKYQHWALFYLASRFQNPLYEHFQKEQTGGNLYDLIYYSPVEGDLAPQDVALDKYFRKTEVASMRSSWTDRNALFTAIKCGKNGIAHSHQDLGSFAFYALGEMWAVDPGTEGQTYQSHKHHIPRSHFYRIRAEGHNTLVFNPTERYSQAAHGTSVITRFETSASEALAVADLTDVYGAYAESVTRGYRLFDQRRMFLVQDEITGKAANDIWWFAHSGAGTEFEIADDGQTAFLRRNGRTCQVRLLSPAGAAFVAMDARPLPTTPDPEIQNPNKNMKKLALHLPETKDVTITVLFAPSYDFEDAPEAAAAVTPIRDWVLKEDTVPRLAAIQIDGEPIDGYSSDVFTYTVNLPAETKVLPSLAAMPVNEHVHVDIALPKSFPGTSRIRTANLATGAESLYLVRFLPIVKPGGIDKPQFTPKPVTVNGITVTASCHDGNVPANVLDGDPATRWSANGEEEWIAFDFGKAKAVAKVGIAWFNGDKRQTAFSISLSDDGKTWQQILKTQSSGKAADIETYDLPQAAPRRHLKITGYGNTSNLWNSITEATFE